MNFDDLFVFSQYLAPQHLLSRSAGTLANCRMPSVRDNFIQWFVKRYGVDLSEAEREHPGDYENFNDFFTRALKPGVRPIADAKDSLVCPVDGTVSQAGSIEQGRIFQAKGQSFTATELLGGDKALAEPFSGGSFSTIYLSPKDYHRIHMPIKASVREMVYIPGKLFSVNPVTTSKVPRLFARNERVAVIFDTDIGPMAMVLVGAMIVASIETVWSGEIAPIRRQIKSFRYDLTKAQRSLKKGEEMGRFKLGSTVVMLFPSDTVSFNDRLQAQAPVQMGQEIGKILG